MAVLLAAATVAAIDLSAKAVSEARLADSSVDLGLIQLRLAYNPGVAFSMGDKLPAGVIVAITAAISILFAVYAWHRAPQAGWVERIAGGDRDVVSEVADERNQPEVDVPRMQIAVLALRRPVNPPEVMTENAFRSHTS